MLNENCKQMLKLENFPADEISWLLEGIQKELDRVPSKTMNDHSLLSLAILIESNGERIIEHIKEWRENV